MHSVVLAVGAVTLAGAGARWRRDPDRRGVGRHRADRHRQVRWPRELFWADSPWRDPNDNLPSGFLNVSGGWGHRWRDRV